MSLEEQWMNMYEFAKIYFEHYGNLYVPVKFKTDDGFTYNEDGNIHLGQWIAVQRSNYSHNKLIKERFLLLDKICMVWHTGRHKQDIRIICIDKDIDYNLNKDILDHISIQELDSKLRFLFESGMSFTNEAGKLHEIFNINSNILKQKYGLSLVDLINKYYKVNVCAKVKEKHE